MCLPTHAHPPNPTLPDAGSTAVGPRRILARDDALDYDVMSDQEWEEEPEGARRRRRWRGLQAFMQPLAGSLCPHLPPTLLLPPPPLQARTCWAATT